MQSITLQFQDADATMMLPYLCSPLPPTLANAKLAIVDLIKTKVRDSMQAATLASLAANAVAQAQATVAAVVVG